MKVVGARHQRGFLMPPWTLTPCLTQALRMPTSNLVRYPLFYAEVQMGHVWVVLPGTQRRRTARSCWAVLRTGVVQAGLISSEGGGGGRVCVPPPLALSTLPGRQQLPCRLANSLSLRLVSLLSSQKTLARPPSKGKSSAEPPSGRVEVGRLCESPSLGSGPTAPSPPCLRAPLLGLGPQPHRASRAAALLASCRAHMSPSCPWPLPPSSSVHAMLALRLPPSPQGTVPPR